MVAYVNDGVSALTNWLSYLVIVKDTTLDSLLLSWSSHAFISRMVLLSTIFHAVPVYTQRYNTRFDRIGTIRFALNMSVKLQSRRPRCLRSTLLSRGSTSWWPMCIIAFWVVCRLICLVDCVGCASCTISSVISKFTLTCSFEEIL